MQLEETKELLMKELKAAKKMAAQVPLVQELANIDIEIGYQLTDEVDQLIAENEQMRSLVSSLEKRIDETEKKYEETYKLSEKWLKQALEAESTISELKIAKHGKQSLQERISELEVESIKQQALLSSSAGKLAEFELQATRLMENGHHVLVRNVPRDPDELVGEHVERFFCVNHPSHCLSHQIVVKKAR